VIAADDRGLKLKGIETKEPAFGLPAVWVGERKRKAPRRRVMSLWTQPLS